MFAGYKELGAFEGDPSPSRLREHRKKVPHDLPKLRRACAAPGGATQSSASTVPLARSDPEGGQKVQPFACGGPRRTRGCCAANAAIRKRALPGRKLPRTCDGSQPPGQIPLSALPPSRASVHHTTGSGAAAKAAALEPEHHRVPAQRRRDVKKNNRAPTTEGGPEPVVPPQCDDPVGEKETVPPHGRPGATPSQCDDVA